MSDDDRDDLPPGAGGDTPDRDVDDDAILVRDFFARERAAAQGLGATSERWQRIVATSQPQRHSWVPYAAVAAAAVVLAAVGLSALGRTSTSPPVPAIPVTSSSVPAPPTSRVPTSTPSTPVGSAPGALPLAGPVPASFAISSLTTGAAGRLFALGTVSCPGGRCAAVARSRDDGRTWTLVHTFTPSTAATPATASNGPTLGRAGGAGTLTQVRFASASVGWAFGGGAMRTTDGGATWHDYPHPGGDVIGLETDGTDVVLTTAPGCSSGTCHGSISVVRAPVTASSATDVAGTIDGGGGVIDAQVSWQGGHAFVSPVVVPVAGRPAPTPVVVTVDGLHRAAPSSCGTGQAIRLVTAAAGTTLFAVCPSGGAAGHIAYAVQASRDGGASWTPVAGTPLLLADAGATSFAAADARRVLAVSGGSPDLHGSMSLSDDGGATWRDPRSAPPLPDHGWAWIGAPGGATFYALSGDGTGAYWMSVDGGETWSRVTVAGR